MAMTPARLWKRMTPGQRLQASRAFWQDEQAVDDQTQAALLISKQKNFRPKTVVALDVDRKARHLAGLTLPDSLAARALIVYHLSEQQAMMSAFLDAVGVAHENGLIRGEAAAPDAAKVGLAAAQIADAFPPETVSLYLNTLLCQDPETWKALEHVPQRLEL